jgi:hypothetical protein
MSRQVKVFKWERDVEPNQYKHIKVELGQGTFIQYGVDYEEFESGAGNFTTAIVEMPDGTVLNSTLNLIQFVEVAK